MTWLAVATNGVLGGGELEDRSLVPSSPSAVGVAELESEDLAAVMSKWSSGRVARLTEGFAASAAARPLGGSEYPFGA